MSFGYRSDGDATARLRPILILQSRYASRAPACRLLAVQYSNKRLMALNNLM